MWNLVCLCVLILHCKLCVPSHFVQNIPLKPGLEVSFHRGFAFASVRLLMESSTQGYCKVHSQPEVYEWLEDVNLVCEPMWRLVLLQIFRASVLLAGQIFPLLRQADFFASCRIWMNVEGPGYSSLPLHFILGFISNRFSILGVILSVCNSRSPWDPKVQDQLKQTPSD